VTRLPPPPVPARSATGAGDSFLGAMVLGLAEGRSPEKALRSGVAAGTAAVLTPGTELCRRADVLRLEGALAG
jgi:6-phosphofructokinase 2